MLVFFGALLAEPRFIHNGFSPRMLMGFVTIIQVYAVSTTFRLVLDYINQLTAQKELEKQNRFAEVNFLRSQINPHFLFNTLNNINALIRLRPFEAEKAIGSLSDLMRYMLNTSKLEKAELGKEMACITNYIELQKLRLSKDFNLKYEINIKDESVFIEPLLLIGFIENTFKHGVSGADDDFIEIRIISDSKQLQLNARNKIHQSLNISDIVSGVGLDNIEIAVMLSGKV
ncbi:MAG: histidine kinase [Sphingobacteriaceae bacterium]|nr:histidine kinase [Sphingobacteriaceae bacterium]